MSTSAFERKCVSQTVVKLNEGRDDNISYYLCAEQSPGHLHQYNSKARCYLCFSTMSGSLHLHRKCSLTRGTSTVATTTSVTLEQRITARVDITNHTIRDSAVAVRINKMI